MERARSVLKSYLLPSGKTSVRPGGYQIEQLNDGRTFVTTLPSNRWEQLEIAPMKKAV